VLLSKFYTLAGTVCDVEGTSHYWGCLKTKVVEYGSIHVSSAHPSRRVSRARLFWRNIMGCCAAPDWGQRSLWGCCTLLCCASLGAFEALAFSAVLVGRRTSARCWRGHQVGEMEENQTWQWATLDHVYGSRLRSSKNNSIVPDILWGFYCWNLGPSIRSVPRIWPSQKPSAGEPSSLVSGVQVAASNDSNGLQGNDMKLLHYYITIEHVHYRSL
jgi:hypothetical protein